MAVHKDPKVKKKPWYYHLETRDEKGKRKIIKKRGFKTKTEATQAYTEALSLYNKGFFVHETKLLYKDYLKQYLEDKQTKVKPRTLETYTWLVEKHVIPNIGKYELSKLTPMILQKLYNQLTSEKTLSDENIQKIHTLINDSLKKAVRWELVAKNVATLVDRPKARKKEMQIWTNDEALQFLHEAKKSRYYVAFLIAITCGMRQGEILGLRWKDVDFDNCTFTINQTLSHDGKELVPDTKSSAGNRSISVDDITMNQIRMHRKFIDSEKHATGELYQDFDLVMPSSIGTPANPRNLNRVFYNLIKNNNLPKIRFHDLRHTHCSMLLSQGENIKVIAERLGHANVRTTLDRYSHLLPNMQKETAKNFGKIFYGTSQNN